MTGRTLAVVPTYDERDNLPVVVAGLRAVPGVDVLVVDDASPDGTGDLAEDLAAADPAVHVLRRPAKAGLGSAYRDGLGWGLAQGYDRLVMLDADGSHDPAALPELLAAAERSDLVVGSRYVPAGRVERWPVHRRLLSRAGNLYARAMTGMPVRDGTSGYRVVRRDVLEAIDLRALRSDGYAFQLEVVWRAWQAGFAVLEVPIVFVERRTGASKLSRAVVLEAAWRTTSWVARGGRRPAAPHARSVRVAAGPGGSGSAQPGR